PASHRAKLHVIRNRRSPTGLSCGSIEGTLQHPPGTAPASARKKTGLRVLCVRPLRPGSNLKGGGTRPLCLTPRTPRTQRKKDGRKKAFCNAGAVAKATAHRDDVSHWVFFTTFAAFVLCVRPLRPGWNLKGGRTRPYASRQGRQGRKG